MKVVSCDVLIIGSGGAGARAAIEAHDRGAHVIVVAKTLEGKAHTVMAEGGINAALGFRDPDDSWESHFMDTVEEGVFLNDQRMAEILARESPDRVFDLERFGAMFDRDEQGRIAQRPFGGQSHRRTCYVGDTTGHEVIMTLVEAARHRGIDYRSELVVTTLLHDPDDAGTIIGAFAIEVHSGSYLVFLASATILATGGAGRIYTITSNPVEATGDGYAMALRSGATLVDMEQTQFHPTSMIFPESAKGMLVTEAVRGEGGYLLNSEDERFMKRYNPEQMELSPRDQTARAIYTEIQEGRGTPRGGVHLDITHKGRDLIMARIPRMVKQFEKFANIDITTFPMEVAPTAHHFMGGVRVVPETCESTDLPGLFACGEAAGGTHGANRLGGNALAETQVFGKRAGEAAADYAVGRSPPVDHDAVFVQREIERLEQPLGAEGAAPHALKEELGRLMWENAGIVRNEKLLVEGLRRLRHLGRTQCAVKGSRRYNPDWVDYIELQNMVLVSECVLTCALSRKESRGAHYRSDHPKRDDSSGLVHYTCTLQDEVLHIGSVPVEITRADPTMRKGD